MDIKEKIQEIINHRKGLGTYVGKGHLDEVKKKKDFFLRLIHSVEKFKNFREVALQQITDQTGEYYIMSSENPMFEQCLEDASPNQVIEEAKNALSQIERLEKRFSRDTVNISVVGRARQGKSRLLQSISGLANEVIPASNGGDCTGAKSVITNHVGESYAHIKFYDELEMIEQIQKYMDAIGIHRKLTTLAQVPSLKSDIEDFISTQSGVSGKKQSYFEHFRKYVDFYDEYKGYVGTTLVEKDLNQVRKYVAQYGVDMQPTYAYLAVKEAEILTPYPYSDAGKIVLIDTIGLGDTSLGIRDKMIRTLREDSDAAILVRLPSANGDGIREEDDELYDLISEAMGAEALSKWLFLALNVCDELGNMNSGLAMEKAFKSRKLNFAFLQMLNCGSQQDVEENLLKPILLYLSDNLSDVDNKMIASANKTFNRCWESYYSLCNKIDQLSNNSFSESLNSGGLFDELYSDDLALAQKLEQLTYKYKGHDKKCQVIEDEVRKTIKKVVLLSPTEEEILAELQSGKLSAHVNIVYENFADHFRASISDQFEEINKSVVANIQEDFKSEIIHILRAEDGGKLNAIPLALESNTPSDMEWMEAFINQKLNDFPLVKEAFESVLTYRLNIEGYLECKVNKCLECLDPEEKGQFSQLDFSSDTTKEEEAEKIEQALLSSINQLAGCLVNEIQDVLKLPYSSFYARIRKFRERIIYSKKGERELKNMYREYATSIWKDKFAAIAKKQGALSEINELKETLAANRTKSLFLIKF